MKLMREADMNLTFQILMSEMGLQIAELQQQQLQLSLKPPCTNNLCIIWYFVPLFCKINKKEEQDHNICQLVIYHNPLADLEDNQYFSIFTYLPSL
ncbi:hypothetical protein NC652_015920 [Populus alba x Populus x berolinensis]|nr:hypothetical protein NC652_015920 [Populus alba x Populus x berolinensis]